MFLFVDFSDGDKVWYALEPFRRFSSRKIKLYVRGQVKQREGLEIAEKKKKVAVFLFVVVFNNGNKK